MIKKFLKKLKSDHFRIVEDVVNEFLNLYIQLIFLYKKSIGKYPFLKKNINLENIHKNKRIIIIANGPSIKDFDLKKLKDEIVIMVNRSFNHPDYELIKPNYHIFVDPKLATGAWPINYLDIVFKKNPSVKLILNADWYNLEKFKDLKNQENVFWVKNKGVSLLYTNFNNDMSQLYSALGVTGHAVNLATYTGSKKIYILGMELNGVIKLLNNQDSHFSGKDPDYINHTILDWAKDLSSNARGFRYWYAYVQNCKSKDIELINLSNKGLFNFVPKADFNKLFR